jgi:metal-sulfur cluster biosynthetic enzyme
MNFYTENNKIEIDILQKLKDVIDPEVAINIVDLGLIYNVTFDDVKNQFTITMTLSTKGCPMGDKIMSEIIECIKHYYPTCTTELKLVWEPEWSREFITPEGKRQLGMK